MCSLCRHEVGNAVLGLRLVSSRLLSLTFATADPEKLKQGILKQRALLKLHATRIQGVVYRTEKERRIFFLASPGALAALVNLGAGLALCINGLPLIGGVITAAALAGLIDRAAAKQRIRFT